MRTPRQFALFIQRLLTVTLIVSLAGSLLGAVFLHRPPPGWLIWGGPCALVIVLLLHFAPLLAWNAKRWKRPSYLRIVGR